MIKNVVFDIGRVLLDYQPIEFLRGFDINDEEVTDLHDIIFGSNLWLELDKGTITKEEAVDTWCMTAPQYKEKIYQIMDTWTQMLTPIEGTEELLKELVQKGYNVYLLSNFNEHGFNQIKGKHAFIEMAKGAVISYEVKRMKPDEEIYRHLLNKFHLKAEETVFIDDLEENIKGAKKVGIQGIRFEDACKTKKGLADLGVLL